MENNVNEAFNFHISSINHKVKGNLLAADYDMFRAILIDMINVIEGNNADWDFENRLGLKNRQLLVRTEKSYVIKNIKGEPILCIKSREGEARLPEIFYSGGKNAFFRRRFDQFVLLEDFSEEIKNVLDEAAISGSIMVTDTENPEDINIKKYNVPIRLLPESVKMDKPEDLRDCMNLFFSPLYSLVRNNNEKPIKEIIHPDDLPNLAAILAREEDYTLLEKYISEGNPLNEWVSWWYTSWQPTPFFCLTGYKSWDTMKDTEKMLHFLADNGADPNLATKEGDTPLGNLCFNDGQIERMKVILDCGASPNIKTKVGESSYMPLHLTLFPESFDETNNTFQPTLVSQLEKAKLLIEAGADVNAKLETGCTPFALVMLYASGADRINMLELLCKKGADVDTAIKYIEECASKENPQYYYALYEFFYCYPGQTVNSPEITNRQANGKALKFLELSTEAGYPPAVKTTKHYDEWDDTDRIAIALHKAYPNKVPVAQSRENILKLIQKLGLTESPEPPHRIYLTAITRRWILLWHGLSDEEFRKQQNSLPPDER